MAKIRQFKASGRMVERDQGGVLDLHFFLTDWFYWFKDEVDGMRPNWTSGSSFVVTNERTKEIVDRFELVVH